MYGFSPSHFLPFWIPSFASWSRKKTNSGAADAAKIDAGAIDTASAKSSIDSAESKLRLTLKTKFEEKSIDGELDKETFKSVVVDILTEQGVKKMPSAKDLDMVFEIADANNSDSVSLLEFMGFFFSLIKKGDVYGAADDIEDDAADDAQVLFAEGDLVETACGEEGEDEYWMPAQIKELLYDEENKIVVDG